MDDLKALAVFAETVDAGSMSAAGRRLGMSPSAVSQTIRALEARGGVALLHRSTRKMVLTEAGARYYPHCKRLLDAARDAAASLQSARDQPTGELRVSAPVGFAGHIALALAPLLRDSPRLSLRLLVDDAMIDLIDARIDVAVRVGQLGDSTWVARHLFDLETMLFASPEYLGRHGTPATPQDLAAHQWLAASRDTASSMSQWPVDLHGAAGRVERVLVDARIVSNNQMALQQMCQLGLGIARLAPFDVAGLVAGGALVPVLAPWRSTTLPVAALTPRRDGEAAKVRAALDHLKRHFAAAPPG